MQRRKILTTSALGFGGLISWPIWAESWNVDSLKRLKFSTDDDALLAEIVETILPETNTPGAKSLGVHKLIQKMVSDCQGKVAEEKLIANLNKLENLAGKTENRTFGSLSADKKLAFLKSLEKSDDFEMKTFYSQIKRMTINGYMKSEYVMTNITHFEYAPGKFSGCVEVTP